MMGVVKEFGELTVSDLVMFCWVEMTEDGKTKFMFYSGSDYGRNENRSKK